jgi:hypothetical protein
MTMNGCNYTRSFSMQHKSARSLTSAMALVTMVVTAAAPSPHHDNDDDEVGGDDD